MIVSIAALLLLLLPCAPRTEAQPPIPPPPAKYNAILRYHITAPRDQHVAQFDAMIAHLEKLAFDFVPPLEDLPANLREDPRRTQLTGVVSSASALKIVNNPAIASLLLVPADFELPKDAAQRVQVQIELASGFGPQRQTALLEQARLLLSPLGFREATGYDQRGYTGRPHSRLRGTIPVSQLELLLKDIRRLPTGWFEPALAAADLPPPIRSVSPLLITQVLADSEPTSEPAPPEPRGDDNLDKISADLWALVNQKEQEEKFVRLEVILSTLPRAADEGWRHSLKLAAPSLVVEGRLGQMVTAVAQAREARALAAAPLVATVRLPRPPRTLVAPTVKFKTDDAKVLEQSGLAALHKTGARGKGVRVAVIDGDFRGFEVMVKEKRLPAGTRLADLTAQCTPALQPDPFPAGPAEVGHGTHCALAVALAAPEADITLVRIDPGAPYMLQEVAGYVRGDPDLSRNLIRRFDELTAETSDLRGRRGQILRERKAVLENFEDDSPVLKGYGILGPVRAWLYSPREWHRARLAELEHDEKNHRVREMRLLQLVEEVRSLKGIQVVSSSLVWNDGYALGGRGALTRFFEEALQRNSSPAKAARGPNLAWPAFWFVTAGNTRGQAWNGLLQDSNSDGVMEFAGPDAKLPKGSWTRTLNFLAWQPFEGARSAELPEKATVRVSMQWSEPHDPDYYVRPGEPDLYRRPLAEMRFVVLRQRDPDAKTLPADDFEVVARTWERPQRLQIDPNSATYEMSVEFTVAKAGRYALRVERQLPYRWVLVRDPRTGKYFLQLDDGLTPTGIRPLGVPVLPALEPHWELRPRFFVQAVDDTAAPLGRSVFRDFATDLGTIGSPADGRSIFPVGAVDLAGQAAPYSAPGPPPNLELFLSPRLLAPDALSLGVQGRGSAIGADLATPFAAGATASMLSGGWTRAQVLERIQTRQRQVLHIPSRTAK